MSDVRWYAVHTGPRLEATASLNLRRQGFWVHYPFIRVRKSRKRALSTARQVHVVEEPYFPRYLFVALRSSRPDQTIYRVNQTDGVSTVVYCGEEPLEIPAPVMRELMRRADEAGQVANVDRVARKPYEEGDRIQFLENTPLAGLIATVIVDAGNKIKVWCEHLGRVSEITVPPEFVAEIAP